jgi:hypothetical protein
VPLWQKSLIIKIKFMAIKKQHTIAPKKSDAKKKTEAANSKTKSDNSKQTIRKKLNEFGDTDSL